MDWWRRLLNHIVPRDGNAYRPRMLSHSWLVFFLAVTLAAEGFLVAQLVARQSGNSFLAAVIQGDIIALTNEERVQNNVATLVENTQLDAEAQAKADDMAAKGYFSHVGPDGKTPWDWITTSGYVYQYAGENLAVRFTDSTDVVNAWMASPTHRANIVKPVYEQIGVSIAQGMYQGQIATYVVQYFGTPPLATASGGWPVAAAPAPAVAPTPIPSAPAPQVAGAEAPAASAPAAPGSAAPVTVSTHESSSLFQSITRQFARIASNPRESAGWVLGGVATLLVVLLILAFFVHIRIQPHDLLLPGVVVAGVAVFFIAFNGTFLPAGASGGPAAAALSGGSGLVIDPVAAVAP